MSRIPFNQQIKNFQNTLDQITDNLGAIDVAKAIGNSIFFVGMGSNDYLNNYLMPNYPTKNQYNAQQYADLLVQQYTQQLQVIISHFHLLVPKHKYVVDPTIHFASLSLIHSGQTLNTLNAFVFCVTTEDRLFTISEQGSLYLQG